MNKLSRIQGIVAFLPVGQWVLENVNICIVKFIDPSLTFLANMRLSFHFSKEDRESPS